MSKTKEERHKDVVREYYRIKNERDYDAADDIIHDDFTAVYPGANGLKTKFNKEILQKTWSQGADAMDLHYDVHELIAEGEWVVAHLNYTGTHEGELMGIEPTGNTIDVEQHLQLRFEDEQIVEGFSTYNALNGWWRELRVMPPIDFNKGPRGTHPLREEE